MFEQAVCGELHALKMSKKHAACHSHTLAATCARCYRYRRPRLRASLGRRAVQRVCSRIHHGGRRLPARDGDSEGRREARAGRPHCSAECCDRVGRAWHGRASTRSPRRWRQAAVADKVYAPFNVAPGTGRALRNIHASFFFFHWHGKQTFNLYAPLTLPVGHSPWR